LTIRGERLALDIQFGVCADGNSRTVCPFRCVQGRHDVMHKVVTTGFLVPSPVNAKQS
jgi:hypothetical protein